jgi:hypothetical protein
MYRLTADQRFGEKSGIEIGTLIVKPKHPAGSVKQFAGPASDDRSIPGITIQKEPVSKRLDCPRSRMTPFLTASIRPVFRRLKSAQAQRLGKIGRFEFGSTDVL